MKLSKEELIKKISEYDIGDEIKIELLEDVTDSFEIPEIDNTELEEIKAKYEELKEKYKERFLGNEEKEEKEESEELKEEEIIDVKEI